MPTLTYRDALNQALREEMQRAGHARRRQGPPQGGDPRRQPRDRAPGGDAVQHQGGGARGGVRRADRPGRREADGAGRDADLPLENRVRRPQGRRATRRGRGLGGSRRPALAAAARRGDDHRVGRQDQPRRRRRGGVAALRHRCAGGGRDPTRSVRPPRCPGAAGDAGRRADALQQAARAPRQAKPRESRRRGAARALPRLTMATKVFMEALSPTMEEGRLVKWHKREGDAVKTGETLAEVETDKAVMDLVARADGVLRQVAVTEGQTVPVGSVVAVIAAAGETVGPSAQAPAPAPAGKGEGGGGGATPAPSRAAPTAPAIVVGDATRVKASPLAKRIATESGVDLKLVTGSGPGGRVVKRDLEHAATRP